MSLVDRLGDLLKQVTDGNAPGRRGGRRVRSGGRAASRKTRSPTGCPMPLSPTRRRRSSTWCPACSRTPPSIRRRAS